MLAIAMPNYTEKEMEFYAAFIGIFNRHYMYDNRWTYPLLQFSIPLSFLIVLSFFILDILNELKQKRERMSKCASRNTEAKMVLGVVLVFVFLETPGVWAEDNGSPTDLTPFLYVRVLSYFNSSMNFFVFCLSGRRFRNKIRALFRRSERT
jgi:hypothetical protein